MFDSKISEEKLEEAIGIACQAHNISPTYAQQIDLERVKEWREKITPEMVGGDAPLELTTLNVLTHNEWEINRREFPVRSDDWGWEMRRIIVVEGNGFWIKWDSFNGIERIGESGDDEGLSWADWEQYWASDCLIPKALER